MVYSKGYQTLRVTCVHTCTGATIAHIHGPIGDTDPIATTDSSNLWLTLNPRPSTAGTNLNVFEGTATGITAADHTRLINARFYVNIHSSSQSGGCTRGQVYPAGFAGLMQNQPGPSHIAVMDQIQAGFGPTSADQAYDTGRIGVALAWFNPLTNTMNTKQYWSGLSGAPTAAHIHGPTSSMNTWFGAMTPNTANFPWAIATTGTTATSGSTNSNLAVTAQQKTDLDAGNYYYNIHTSANGGGEIRGQLVKSTCYPYSSTTCPVYTPAGGSSSSSSSGGTGGSSAGSASTLAVSGLFFTLAALVAALLQ
jgi:hypothetical protein